MVLLCALAGSQAVNVHAVEPLYLGEARVSPSLTALVMADSNPRWWVTASEIALIGRLQPAVGVTLDAPGTYVDAALSGMFWDVIGDAAQPPDSWAVVDAKADLQLFRRRPVGVQVAYIGRLRTDGGARDILTEAPSFVNDVELGVPMHLASPVNLTVSGRIRSSSYQFWGGDWRLQPYNYSDAVCAQTEGLVGVAEGLTVGASFASQQHRWGAQSPYIESAQIAVPSVVALRDALRPVGVLTTDVSKGTWSFHAGLGWDGTQIQDVDEDAPRMGADDRLIGELRLAVETSATSVALSFERFNDRPIVADLIMAISSELSVQIQGTLFVRWHLQKTALGATATRSNDSRFRGLQQPLA
jgi:hypothetical protein